MRIESASLRDGSGPAASISASVPAPPALARLAGAFTLPTVLLALAAAALAFAVALAFALPAVLAAPMALLALLCLAGAALRAGASPPADRGAQVAEAERNRTMVQQLQAILANASVGIMITRNGRFELVGHHLCHMFGYTEGELIGQRTSTIYQSEEAYVALGPRMTHDLTAHGRFDGELVMRRRNGNEFWVHMLGRAVIPGNSSGGTIWILEDISQAREARDQLSWTATHDSLTGLVNRKEFESRVGHALSQCRRQTACVMFIDLDLFKAVNDTAGHAAGDEVLRSVGALFESAVRQTDTVARLGGDEFSILLPGCPLVRAQAIAEQVRAAVEAYRLHADGRSFAVGTSIGLVELDADMPTIAAVLHAADVACYDAKRGGRNRVVTYVPDAPDGSAQPAPVTAI